MSNQIHIEPTQFVDVRTGQTSYGVRVYDDYDQSYDNTWESIPDDDMDVLAKVIDECDDEKILATIDHLNEMRCPIHIGDEMYEEEQYKHLFEEENA